MRVMDDPLSGPAFASCRLDAQQRRLRADELAALLVPSVLDLERAPARLTLTLDLDRDRLQQLGRVLSSERECCSFWRFALAATAAGPTRLLVEVEPGHEDALTALDRLVDELRR
jgi:hypothetical protein